MIKLFAILCFAFQTWASLPSDTLSLIKQRPEKKLFVGAYQGYIPFSMKTPQGKWVGFEIEMAQAFAKDLGLTAEFVDNRWESIIPSLQTKKFDILVAGMTVTQERAQTVLFSEGYYDASLKLMLNQKLQGKVTKMEDLNKPGMKITVQLGTTGDFFATKHAPNASIIRMDTESDASNTVLLGKADGFLLDAPYVDLFVRRHQGKVFSLPDRFSDEHLGVAMRKGDAALMASFNDFLKRWKSSGEYEKRRKFYFDDLAWLKDFPNLK